MTSRVTAEQVAGAQIRALRMKRKWSLARLGQEVGLTRQAVLRIEQGKVAPPLSRYDDFARALGVPRSAIVSDGDAQQGETKH
jgi:transcriptional regulator with XRE-family HTH domain